MAKKIVSLATLDIHTTRAKDPVLEEKIFRALYECQKIIESIDKQVGCSIHWQPENY